MITGVVPFDSKNIEEIKRAIIEKPVIFPEGTRVDERAIHLIHRMLDKNRQTRIRMHEIMQNSWLFPDRLQFDDFDLGTSEDLEMSAVSFQL